MNNRARQAWFPNPRVNDDTYAHRGENTVDWLARSTTLRARECRRFLNENISKLPPHDQSKFVHDLREHWNSTFFELITARILQELGASITLEAAAATGKRPDFIAEFSDATVVVEAKAPVINKATSEKEATRIPLLNFIEAKIPPGWLVGVWELPDIRPNDSKREFKRVVEQMLKVAAPGPNDTPRELTATLPQGLLHLHLFPTGASHQRLGLEAPIALVDNTQDRIRHALKAKRTQVRNSKEPVILAIQASGYCSDFEDFDVALFGHSYERYDQHRKSVASGFLPDGVFKTKAVGEPTFAAILAFLTVGFNACRAPVLYLHPRFDRTLPKGLLQLEQRRFNILTQEIETQPSTVTTLIGQLNLVSV